MSIIMDVLFVIKKLILLLRFKLLEDGNHKDHAYAVFQYNANKVTYNTISYGRIQATNAYMKSIGEPVDGKRGSTGSRSNTKR